MQHWKIHSLFLCVKNSAVQDYPALYLYHLVNLIKQFYFNSLGKDFPLVLIFELNAMTAPLKKQDHIIYKYTYRYMFTFWYM